MHIRVDLTLYHVKVTIIIFFSVRLSGLSLYKVKLLALFLFQWCSPCSTILYLWKCQFKRYSTGSLQITDLILKAPHSSSDLLIRSLFISSQDMSCKQNNDLFYTHPLWLITSFLKRATLKSQTNYPGHRFPPSCPAYPYLLSPPPP